MTTTETPAPYKTYTVRIARSGRDFGKAVAAARGFDGVYDGETKTWTIRLWAGANLDTAEQMGVTEYLRCNGLALVES